MANPPDWYQKGLDHIWLPYIQMKTTRPPLPVVGTKGCHIQLADGRKLIDGIASWWTAAHGYNHPHIIKAVQKQLEAMPHVMFGGLVHEQALTLASRLATLLPGDLSRVFFSESGSVSVEVAMKMAVQYWLNKGVEGRTQFLSFRGGYHGDTAMTMSVCDPEEGMHSLLKGYLPAQILADLPIDDESEARLDTLLTEKKNCIAAMITEPLVQGAGGMLFHDAETLKRLRRLSDKHDVLLILDEIFTGFGRLGSMFACEHADIVPDIITLSKALTGGVAPLSAAVARSHIFEAFYDDDPLKALMHGPTYMAHALGCAAANASLDLFAREDRLGAARSIGDQLNAELDACRRLDIVRDVRQKGAVGVVELDPVPDFEVLKARFVEMGCWIRPFRNIVYLTPPLTISEEELSCLTGAIVKGLSEL